MQPFVPLQPVYGPNRGETHASRFMPGYVRTFRVLQALSRIDFDSCLDVGAGEGYTISLVERLFGGDCAALDARVDAAAAAHRLYGVESVAGDANSLPFRAGSFDVVISTETIEHLHRPVEAVLEWLRVARKAVIVSTCEAAPSSTLVWIDRRLTSFDDAMPPDSDLTGHINFFEPRSLWALLGRQVVLWNQHVKPGFSRVGRRALSYRGGDRDEIKKRLRTVTWTPDFVHGSRGVVALRVLDDQALRGEPRRDDETLLDALLDHVVTAEGKVEGEGLQTEPRTPRFEVLRERTECPACQSPEELQSLLGGCPRCSSVFALEEGVPILRPAGSGRPLAEITSPRYSDVLRRAGLVQEELVRVKSVMERRREVRNPMARAGLWALRRLVSGAGTIRRALLYRCGF